jgi:hypothetical protein
MGFYVLKMIKGDSSVKMAFCSDKKNVPDQISRMKNEGDTDEQFLVLEQRKDAKFYALIPAPKTIGGNICKGPVDTEAGFYQLKKQSSTFKLIQAVPYFFKEGKLLEAS